MSGRGGRWTVHEPSEHEFHIFVFQSKMCAHMASQRTFIKPVEFDPTHKHMLERDRYQ